MPRLGWLSELNEGGKRGGNESRQRAAQPQEAVATCVSRIVVSKALVHVSCRKFPPVQLGRGNPPAPSATAEGKTMNGYL